MKKLVLLFLLPFLMFVNPFDSQNQDIPILINQTGYLPDDQKEAKWGLDWIHKMHPAGSSVSPGSLWPGSYWMENAQPRQLKLRVGTQQLPGSAFCQWQTAELARTQK
ncbi:MAG: hypothetical protein ACLFM7_10685 [Bacteroidales bacterium]